MSIVTNKQQRKISAKSATVKDLFCKMENFFWKIHSEKRVQFIDVTCLSAYFTCSFQPITWFEVCFDFNVHISEKKIIFGFISCFLELGGTMPLLQMMRLLWCTQQKVEKMTAIRFINKLNWNGTRKSITQKRLILFFVFGRNDLWMMLYTINQNGEQQHCFFNGEVSRSEVW